MISHARALSKIIFIDLVGSVAWFPIWWYSRGLFGLIEWCLQALRYRIRAYAFRIWIKNFLVPMYGQFDIFGRIISVLMRFVVLIGRGIGLLIEALVYVAVIMVWALLPIVSLSLFLLSFLKGT